MGFTLAEVLITLVIIGVIAAITVPTMLAKYNEQQTVAALKRFYSTISQAYSLATQNGNTIDTWKLDDPNEGINNLVNNLRPYLSIAKDCKTSLNCLSEGISYKYLNGPVHSNDTEDTQYSRLILNNGTFVMIEILNPTCSSNRGTNLMLQNVCSGVWVDINGEKKPNQYGKDWFAFYITKYGVIPRGTKFETGSYSLENNCKNKTKQGYSCAAWVIENQNMDYLRHDVSW